MQVNRADLLHSLRKVYPAIGINVLVPEFQCFHFQKDVIVASDGVIIISSPLPEDFELECLIPGAPFLKFLESLSDKEIELKIDGDSLKVISSKVESSFSILKASKQLAPDLEGEVIEVGKDEVPLIRAFEFCQQGVSKDETLGALCGVRISDDTIFGCDRFRILKADSPISGMNCSIPAKLVPILSRFMSQIDSIICRPEENFGAILRDGTIISSTLLEGEYPNVGEYFPTEEDSFEELEFENHFLDILDRHIAFLKDVEITDRILTISVSNDICEFRVVNPLLGEMKEEVDLSQAVSQDFSFQVDPVSFKSIAENSENLNLQYYKESGLLYYTDEKFHYLMRTAQ